MSKKPTYQQEIGAVIARLRREKELTQTELAELVGTSQSAIHRIEKGDQNISLELIRRLSTCFGRQILSINSNASQSFLVHGGKQLHGEITINTSKNAAVALLCASLLNRGKTTLHHLARIEEVFRIIEVLESIGVKCRWTNRRRDLVIISPDELKLENLNLESARKTRSVIMLMGPLLHRFSHFRLPYAGGCDLGVRTIDPHLKALSAFGLSVDATSEVGFYNVSVEELEKATFDGVRSAAVREAAPSAHGRPPLGTRKAQRAYGPDGRVVEGTFSSSHDRDIRITLIERGDTVTENALMAAALHPGRTTIIGASPNYMVQDLCFFLQKLGVRIDGIGTTTLTIHGRPRIERDVDFYPSEDPIEAMSFIAVALVTGSQITIRHAPIEFLEIELEVLKSMGADIRRSSEYHSANGQTRLVDLHVKKSKLVAPVDKIHPMPFPGLNIDNLPFFSVIAASAEGRTLIHDWVFENRAIYITELTKLNAKVELLDAHRVYVEGPTNWHAADLTAPPALRPAVVILIAMLAAPGTSILRNIYSINRGYQDFARRLNHLGADISPLAGI